MKPFLITGTGRCGTAYVADALRACGIACGHQQVIRHEHVLGRAHNWAGWAGDSSFEAVPLLKTLRAEASTIILLVRHPLRVIASWCALGAFDDDMRERWIDWSRVLDTCFPRVLAASSRLERAATYWAEWNTAALGYVDAIMPIESLDVHRLLITLGYGADYAPDRIARIPLDTNTRADAKQWFPTVGWDDLSDQTAARIEGLARALGYAP